MNIRQSLLSRFKGSVREAANDPENFAQNVAQGVDPSFGFGAGKAFGYPDDPSLLLQFAAGMLTPGFGEFKAAGAGLKAIGRHIKEFPEASFAILKKQGGDIMEAIRGASPKELNDFINIFESRAINRLPGEKVDEFEQLLFDNAVQQRKLQSIEKNIPEFPAATDEQLRALENAEDYPGGHVPPVDDLMDPQTIADIFGASPEQMLDVLQNPRVYGLTDDIGHCDGNRNQVARKGFKRRQGSPRRCQQTAWGHTTGRRCYG
jgi:hypothetical protein